MENQQLTLATRCLWEFQEMTPEVEGLMLIGQDGGILTTTLARTQSVQRVAGIVSTLVVLARQATETWNRGEFREVRVRYTDEQSRLRDAQLIIVTDEIILVVIHQRPAALGRGSVTIAYNARQAQQALAHILAGDVSLPFIPWL